MKKLIYAFVLLAVLSACGNSGKKEKVKVMDVALAPPANVDEKMSKAKLSEPGDKQPETSKKILKEGEITFETANVKQTRDLIYKSLTRLGGYIAEENQSNNSDNNRKEYNLKARVPANNFDIFLSSISAAAGKIDSKNIRVKDVTTQFIDLTAQLANKKKLEQRYQELLKQGTKIADLLQIEDKLNEIQTDIDSTQGQLNYLNKAVDYSSLDITFYAGQTAQDNGQTFGYKLLTALSDGTTIFAGVFFGFVGLWPIWVTFIAAYFVTRAWRKNVSRRKAIG